MAIPYYTGYYTSFTATITNCGSSSAKYTVSITDITQHADPACISSATNSGKPGDLLPGTYSRSWFVPVLNLCVGDYTFEGVFTLNRTVVATIDLNLTFTGSSFVAK